MGRAPCCDKANVKRGPWSPEEDAKLKDYIHNYGTGNNWIALPHKAGLKRCGKSCRLRWLNYLRPNIKHGEFSDEEDRIICTLFAIIGSRWSIIAAQLPGRTDNDIKNYWNTKLKKKLMGMSNNTNPTTILQNSPSPESNPLLLSPPPFNSGPNYYNAPPSASLSLTAFDQAAGLFVNSPNGLTAISADSTILQQDGTGYNYLVCGGAPEPSYTSSDGSYSNYQYQDQDQPQQYHGCPPNSGSLTLGETAALMGYGSLEEIKKLISTTNTATSTISSSQDGDCSNSNSFYFDDESNTTGGRVMMYYYG